MSDVKRIMKFECLPNEIIPDCFQYLNGLHIFQSFDQLNDRFNKLIRRTRLHLDFQNIPQRLICDEFCAKILLDQEIKKQIYSLHLSNRNTCYPIKCFLSSFSLEEFINLRSLTLTAATENNLEKLKTMLPLMTKLPSFRMIECYYKTDEILSVLPLYQLRTLMITQLHEKSKLIYGISSLKKLSISYCGFDDLIQILNNASKLNYFKVGYLRENYRSANTENVCSINNYATYLNELIIMMFTGENHDVFMILKRTPKLKSLTINAVLDEDLSDACEWEDFITSSLSYLNVFKFHFEWKSMNSSYDKIHDKFNKFQSDFWCKQHHWYTEYSILKYQVWIYTIPYPFSNYTLQSTTGRYSNQMINNITTFGSVKDLLVIIPSAITEKCQYHFPYVTSLTFEYSEDEPYGNHFLKMQDLKHLKRILNLSNIKNLTFTMSYNLGTEISSVLTEIFKEAPQLSSLTIGQYVLTSLLNDDEFCKYSNKMIKKLHFHDIDLLDNSHEINRFCEVFSNLEHLSCEISQRNSLLFLLQHLSKLTIIKVYSKLSTFREEISWLEEETHKLGIKIITEFHDYSCKNLSIWIIRNIH